MCSGVQALAVVGAAVSVSLPLSAADPAYRGTAGSLLVCLSTSHASPCPLPSTRSTLLTLGVNTFVCLQAEFSLHTPENAWRAGQGLRPYIKDAQRILIRARETNSQRIKQAREGRGWVGAGWAGAPHRR